ncbi:exodeoxyribonuclease V subunit alpha [Halomonas sediminis]
MRDLFEGLDDPVSSVPHPALSSVDELLALLERWVERDWLRALDRALVVFLYREVENAPPLLLLAAAFASHQLGRGHVCLDLATTLAAPDLALSLPPEGDDLNDPPPLPSQVLGSLTQQAWQAALAHPVLIEVGIAEGSGTTPLVRRDFAGTTRLYLRRYWQYEQDIHRQLSTRLDQPSWASHAQTRLSSVLPAALEALFPSTEPGTLDWQKLACALACRSPFAVITGGPGTGKTTTVVKLLALLQALQLGEEESERPLRIKLAAPTGKAAARLNESIAKQVEELDLHSLASLGGNTSGVEQGVDRLRQAIPTQVSTLHRLLGSRPDTRHFRHHAGNLLPLDVLVVDEASMVDIEMMAALLNALPYRARLVLLGDKDQLASVEAGAVLGDLCQYAVSARYTPATCDWLKQMTGATIPEDYQAKDGQALDQAITMLRVSHRFDANSGIGRLAQAVNRPLDESHTPADKRRAVHKVFQPDEQHKSYVDISQLRLENADDPALARLVVNGNPGGFPNHGQGRHDRQGRLLAPPTGYRHYLETLAAKRPPPSVTLEHQRPLFDAWALDVLKAHGNFQLLCVLRKGPWGVEGLNPRIGQALRRARLLDADNHELEHGWYEGRPVLVTRNDYSLGLMNGDIGISLALPNPQAPARKLLRVAFSANDGSGRIKWVLPSRLQAVETVFAMTVHKSQGSEFTHTALLLPDAPNPILTRELVYTGITRARHWLSLVESGRGMLDDAVTREVTRISGLGQLSSTTDGS